MANEQNSWKVDDWVIFDLSIVQIKQLTPYVEVSDGHISTSGSCLLERLRPLTLQNKAIIESFDYRYNSLRKLRGERGFNWPDINQYFCKLALRQIDEMPTDRSILDKASDFCRRAAEYQPIIDGVHLFWESA